MNPRDLFTEYAVTDATTPADFLARYYRPERYTGWGEEYAAVLLASYTADYERDGFVIISHHDSVTGKIVAMYKEQQ